MKNVLDKFNSIAELADKANKAIARNRYEGTTGYGPRFRKMMHFNNRRVHSVPKELRQMERLILDAKIA